MRSDARAKRRALLDAAWTLFANQGPEVSMRTVAAEAGVGIATLYRHFPTRDDLIIGLVEDMLERVLAIVERFRDDWDGSFATWSSFVHELAGLGLAAVAERTIAVTDMDGPVWTNTEHLRRDLTEGYTSILRLASEAGFVSADLSPWRFHLGVAMISRPIPERADYFAPGQAGWLVDNFISGLVVNAGGGSAGTPS